jgi:hypothetical protein
MDLPPLPGDPSLAGIGEGQAGPVAPFPRGPGPGGAPQGEEVVVARRRGLEAANRRRRGKAEEALVEALRRLQARGSVFRIPPFQGLLGALQAAVGGLTGEGQTPDPGLGSRATPAAYLSTPGRPPSPHLSSRGLCGDLQGSPATLCGPPPVPGPSGAFLCAKTSFAKMGTCIFSGYSRTMEAYIGVVGGGPDEDAQVLRSGVLGCL